MIYKCYVFIHLMQISDNGQLIRNEDSLLSNLLCSATTAPTSITRLFWISFISLSDFVKVAQTTPA